MSNFRNNQDYGVNPHAYKATAGKVYDWPLSGIPMPAPAQATSEEDPFDPGTFLYGARNIFPQVIDWPWAADNDGNAFDQNNLYGIRFHCYRRPLADGGGDLDSEWIAVPKLLPSGYTAKGRCDIGPAALTNIADTISPFYDFDLDTDSDLSGGLQGRGPSLWSIRTANSIIPDLIGNPDNYAYAQWVPMNLGQRLWGTEAGGFNSFTELWDDYAAQSDYDSILLGGIATNHIGFRAGKLWFYAGNGIDSGTDTWYIGRRSSDDLPAVPYEVGDFYDTVYTVNVSYTSADFNTPKEVALPGPLLAVNTGRVSDFVVWAKATRHEWDGSLISSYNLLSSFRGMRLAPRTDVPYWFFSSTRNKCAPGGIIAPP